MTAGKRLVIRGWAEVRVAREACWGGVPGVISPMKTCRKCKRSDKGSGHGTLESQRSRKEATEAGEKGMRA